MTHPYSKLSWNYNNRGYVSLNPGYIFWNRKIWRSLRVWIQDKSSNTVPYTFIHNLYGGKKESHLMITGQLRWRDAVTFFYYGRCTFEYHTLENYRQLILQIYHFLIWWSIWTQIYRLERWMHKQDVVFVL